MRSVTAALLLLLVSTSALAMGGDTGVDPNQPIGPGEIWGYYDNDHFKWTNYNDDVHLLVSYSATVVGSLILEHKAGLPRWEAALIMTLVSGLFGTAKEVFHDYYTSRTDIKTWWMGAAAGGLTVMVFKF